MYFKFFFFFSHSSLATIRVPACTIIRLWLQQGNIISCLWRLNYFWNTCKIIYVFNIEWGESRIQQLFKYVIKHDNFIWKKYYIHITQRPAFFYHSEHFLKKGILYFPPCISVQIDPRYLFARSIRYEHLHKQNIIY